MTFNATKFLAVTALTFAGSLIGSSALAQVYRIVGPDGKVTFSDKPPVESSTGKVTNAAGGNSSSGPVLPFELRQVANKFPVTLYTGDNCSPCVNAKAMLAGRGIPFVEKTVTSNEDSQALQRISGETSLPFATIGGQQLKGFSDSEWTQFLNAAGYPKTSALPVGYRQVPPTPLVAIAAAPAPAAAPKPAAPVQAAPAAPPANNPAGIKF